GADRTRVGRDELRMVGGERAFENRQRLFQRQRCFVVRAVPQLYLAERRQALCGRKVCVADERAAHRDRLVQERRGLVERTARAGQQAQLVKGLGDFEMGGAVHLAERVERVLQQAPGFVDASTVGEHTAE